MEDSTIIKTKICEKCKINQSINNFWKNNRNKDGYNKNCKKCSKKIRKKYPINLDIKEKQCIWCNKNKAIIEFGFIQSNKDGYSNVCKKCLNDKEKARKRLRGGIYFEKLDLKEKGYKKCNNCNEIKNIEKFFKVANNQWDSICKECLSKKLKLKRRINAEKQIDFENVFKKCSKCGEIKKGNEFHRSNECTSLLRSRCKKCENKNKLEYYYKKSKYNVQCKLKNILSKRIRKSVKKQNTSKCYKSMELLGCSVDEFKTWLENKVNEPINWKTFSIKYDIDHIIPISAFDLTIPEHQLLCFNYTNLQLLERKLNRRKSNKILPEFKERYEELFHENLLVDA